MIRISRKRNGSAPLALHLCPAVLERERAVEHESAGGRVHVRREVPEALELDGLACRCRGERRLDVRPREHRLRCGIEIAERVTAGAGVRPGDEIEVSANGTSVRAVARLREALPPGAVFLVEGTEENSATALMNGTPRVVEVRKA